MRKANDSAGTCEKSLVVTIDDMGIPAFVFKGSWCGKDVSTVSRLFTRAYNKHNLALRRLPKEVEK